MNNDLYIKISEMKRKYEQEGFIILGVYGSFARGEDSEKSDVDILYELKPDFIDSYGGLGAVERIEEIRQEMEKEFGREIDLACRSSLNRVNKKYILSEVVYVKTCG